MHTGDYEIINNVMPKRSLLGKKPIKMSSAYLRKRGQKSTFARAVTSGH